MDRYLVHWESRSLRADPQQSGVCFSTMQSHIAVSECEYCSHMGRINYMAVANPVVALFQAVIGQLGIANAISPIHACSSIDMQTADV